MFEYSVVMLTSYTSLVKKNIHIGHFLWTLVVLLGGVRDSLPEDRSVERGLSITSHWSERSLVRRVTRPKVWAT